MNEAGMNRESYDEASGNEGRSSESLGVEDENLLLLTVRRTQKCSGGCKDV